MASPHHDNRATAVNKAELRAGPGRSGGQQGRQVETMSDELEPCAAGDPAVAAAAICRYFGDDRPETFRMDDYVVKTATGQYGSIVLHVFDASGEEVAWADTGVIPDTP